MRRQYLQELLRFASWILPFFFEIKQYPKTVINRTNNNGPVTDPENKRIITIKKKKQTENSNTKKHVTNLAGRSVKGQN